MYKLTAYFTSKDGRRIAKRVVEGLSWEKGMDLKEKLLNVWNCREAYLAPQRGVNK